MGKVEKEYQRYDMKTTFGIQNQFILISMKSFLNPFKDIYDVYTNLLSFK